MAAIDLTTGPRQSGLSALHNTLFHLFSAVIPAAQATFATNGNATGRDVHNLLTRAHAIITDGTSIVTSYDAASMQEAWRVITGKDVASIRTDFIAVRDALQSLVNLIKSNEAQSFMVPVFNTSTGGYEYPALTNGQRSVILSELNAIAVLGSV